MPTAAICRSFARHMVVLRDRVQAANEQHGQPKQVDSNLVAGNRIQLAKVSCGGHLGAD